MNIRSAPGDEGARIKHWTSHVSVEEGEKLTRTYADVLGSILGQAEQTVSQTNTATEPVEDQSILENTEMLSKEQVRDMPAKVKETPLAEDSPAVAKGLPDLPNLQPQAYRDLVKECVRETIEQMFRDGDLVSYTRTLDDIPGGEAEQHSKDPVPLAQGGATWDGPDVEAGPFEVTSRTLRLLWSPLLDIPERKIYDDDSFFVLGGDSILAMELARAARDVGLTLTVADIFNSPVFSEMAHLLVSSARKDQMKVMQAASVAENGAMTEIMEQDQFGRFSLLKAANAEAFIQDYICPKIGVFRGGIVDAFPVTDFQALAVAGTLVESKWMLNYITFDGQGFLDLERLRKSAFKLVQLFDILRTVFIPCGNRFYQVVLRELRPQVHVYETEEDFDTYTSQLRDHGPDASPRLGEPFIQFILLRRPGDNAHRIILRLSHAQYDGVCLPKIIEAFRAGYEGSQLFPSPPFSSYVAEATGSANHGHYDYWKGLLQGSSMTAVVHREQPKYDASNSTTTTLKKTIKLPALTSKNITPATILKAAWTLTLAQLTGQSDIVYGNLISGRNVAVEGVESIVGPCLNIIPVRMKLDPKWTALDLLRRIQNQQVAGMPFESLGFREIVQHCTDWPDWTYFSSIVQHQNLAEDVALHLGRTKYKVGFVGTQDTLADLTVVSSPKDGDMVEICLGFVDDGIILPSFVEKALELMCSVAQDFGDHPNSTIPFVYGDLGPKPLTQQHDEIQRIETPPLEAMLRGLTKRNVSEMADTLRRAWRMVLPRSKQDSAFLSLDSSFYTMGGDLIGLASLTAFLEGEGYDVRLEDLMKRPLMGEQIALISSRRTSDSVGRSSTSTLSPSLDGNGQAQVVPVEEQIVVVQQPPPQKRVGGSVWSKAMRLTRKVRGRKAREAQ